MEFVTGWVANIIVFILLAVVIDMILPSSVFQKYTKMVVGLLLVMILLTPILQLINGDLTKELYQVLNEKAAYGSGVENTIEEKKSEIQASQQTYILEQMAVQLQSSVEKEMVQNYSKEITSINIQAKEGGEFPENLEYVDVYLAEKKNDMVPMVQEVHINTSEPVSKIEGEHEKILSFLAEKWNIQEEKLNIHIEGEVDNRG